MENGDRLIIKNKEGLLNIILKEKLSTENIQRVGIKALFKCRWEFHKDLDNEMMISTLYEQKADNRSIYLAFINCHYGSVELWEGYIDQFEGENSIKLFETI